MTVVTVLPELTATLDNSNDKLVASTALQLLPVATHVTKLLEENSIVSSQDESVGPEEKELTSIGLLKVNVTSVMKWILVAPLAGEEETRLICSGGGRQSDGNEETGE